MRVREGDWLKSFKEDGQIFEEYVTQTPTLPTKERQTIYIQPIGEFTEKQKEVLQLTAEYMGAFYKLPVKLNKIKPLGNVPKELKRKNPFDGQMQIRTALFLDKILPEILPKDAAALICFTNYDLFPDENWNYVFGQASFKEKKSWCVVALAFW